MPLTKPAREPEPSTSSPARTSWVERLTTRGGPRHPAVAGVSSSNRRRPVRCAAAQRFARDKYDHFALRSLLKSLGISLRSATEPIDDTSTGKLMEGVLAAFAQFDNDVR
jgi:hypothetical protein